jgi:fumarylacetoacetate (FAA) hydrolase family protein
MVRAETTDEEIEAMADTMTVLPEDAGKALLLGRVHVPGAGPTPVLLRDGVLHDISGVAPTMAHILNLDGIEGRLGGSFPGLGSLDDALAASPGDETRLHLLAPVDLQALKAAGVTFANSLIERVIEERAAGNAGAAAAIRADLQTRIGVDLSAIVPGSDAAMAVKAELQKIGLWSQYMEVGLGADVEVFTKAQPMSSVGHGDEIGLHPASGWNNPEPEVVLIVNARAGIVGATLGNDVNLRDFEGRSALLLGKAKDNNASCSIGPFIRLVDDGFTLDHIRGETVSMTVTGTDGYRLEGSSSMAQISRDLLDIVGQTCNRTHQYPDGFALFTGTMFAPVEDRGAPGMGFTHAIGDVVAIASPRLGTLVNTVTTSDRARPWTMGTTALMDNLARRGLLPARTG